MTKNKIILILAIGLLFSPFISIKAEETDVLLKNLEIKKVEIQKRIVEIRNVKKKKLELLPGQKVKTIIEKIYSKMDSQINKLVVVDAKISTKIALFENAGKDVSQVKAQYEIAKTKLDQVKAEVVTTKIILMEQISNETSKEAIREVVKTAEESIKGAGAEYRKILPLLINI